VHPEQMRPKSGLPRLFAKRPALATALDLGAHNRQLRRTSTADLVIDRAPSFPAAMGIKRPVWRGFRDALALTPRALELPIGRLAAAVGGGDRGGAIRRAAADNINTHLTLGISGRLPTAVAGGEPGSIRTIRLANSALLSTDAKTT
jgi:hypothetical protein